MEGGAQSAADKPGGSLKSLYGLLRNLNALDSADIYLCVAKVVADLYLA